MLRIWASKQMSFSEFFLPDPFLANPGLKKVYEFLDPIFPELIAPLVKKYQADRKAREIDTNSGRPTIPFECVLRSILLKFLHKNCTYEEVEKRLSSDLAWKAFAKLNLNEDVPEHSVPVKWVSFFGEETFRKIHELVVEHLHGKKVLPGKKVRFDSTAREGNIHFPTDSSLLGDAARVIVRTIVKFKNIIKEKIVFRSPMNTVKRHLNRIGHFCRSKTAQAKQSIKRETAKIKVVVERLVVKVQAILAVVTEIPVAVRIQLERHLVLTLKIINQTNVILSGVRSVPGRIVSFFQEQMRPIIRGKAGKHCEFGKKILYGHAEHNLVTAYKLLIGNPPDSRQLEPAIKQHIKLLTTPKAVANDRGFSDPELEERLKKDYHIKRVSIPRKEQLKGHRKRTESSQWFRTLQNWRAGQESAIGIKQRMYGLGRSRSKTERGFDAEVPCGIVAYNLITGVRALSP